MQPSFAVSPSKLSDVGLGKWFLYNIFQRTDFNLCRPRRSNGATQTFRRPSLATSISNSAHQRDGSGTSSGGVYIPPHAARNGALVEERYSKDQLLSLYREQKETNALSSNLSELYAGGWEPQITNGTSGSSWGRRDDHLKDAQPGADICWDHDGSVLPLGLVDMTDEEREVRPGLCSRATRAAS